MERLHQQERLLTSVSRLRARVPAQCHRFGVLVSMLLFMHALGCASTPAVVSKPLPSPVVSRQEEVLDPTLLQAVLGEREGDAYRIGAGDTLLVAVYGHPELSIAPYAGSSLNAAQGSRLSGLVVDNDGTAQFPLIGQLQVAGKTSNELRLFLEQELGKYLKEPKVTVQVVFTGSIRYYLLGQFTQPGVKFSDRPLRLLEALSLGGSVQLEKASLMTAYVVRNGKRLPVNFQRLLREGDLRQNIRLRSGDVVFVPDNSGDTAFVFGGNAGSNPRGGAVPFRNGRLDLLQALADAGFGARERATGKLSETRVIRSQGDRGQLFVIDAERMLNGEAGPFALVPGDIVFVPQTGIAGWNEAMAELLPTLQVVSGLLTPFVQIRYLSQ
jgi:polysaccharide export outer membrane protein